MYCRPPLFCVKKCRKLRFNYDRLLKGGDFAQRAKGKINITIKTLRKISSALGIPPKELFDFDFELEKYKIEE